MSMRLTSLRQSALSALPTLTGLTGLATLALLALAHPASASSLYHETCTGACNGAYAHCCAHVTGVIGASQAGATARVVAACSLAQATCLQACTQFFS